MVEDPPEAADAAVVLAGDPGYERTATGARLLTTGQARLLIVTGGEPGPGDSAASMREQALALGVPAARIRTEEVSHSTREALVAVAPILRREGARTVALVTSPYHQRRASRAARRAWPGVRILNRPAAPSSWRPQGWWLEPRSWRIVLGECAKLAYYVARGWA